MSEIFLLKFFAKSSHKKNAKPKPAVQYLESEEIPPIGLHHMIFFAPHAPYDVLEPLHQLSLKFQACLVHPFDAPGMVEIASSILKDCYTGGMFINGPVTERQTLHNIFTLYDNVYTLLHIPICQKKLSKKNE
uniref:Uncharacterized protein n=1 Tax=Romanomermis culicivorax TaxID=13658 RepID=A0A915I8Y0_ROMCU